MEASSTAEGAERVPPRTVRPAARASDSPSGGVAAYAAEFLGTLMLVFAVAMVVIVNSGGGLGITDWTVIGLVHVFVLMLLVYSLGGASGAHFNPAVTIALALGRKIRPPDAAIYIVVQVLGAIAGAFIAKLLLDDEGAPNNVNYGTPGIADAPEAPAAQPGVPQAPAQGANWLGGEALGGMFAELIGTFFLMWAIMAAAVNPRANRHWAGLIIGSSLGLMVMILGPITGAGLNPARSFGPGIVSGELPNALAYILGPIVGAVLAYVLYTVIVLNPQDRDPGERPIDKLD
jgi:MIP family channel proteins